LLIHFPHICAWCACRVCTLRSRQVDFYLPTLRLLFEGLGRKYHVLCIGHCAHSPWSHHHGPPVSYEDQIEAKVQLVMREFTWLVGADETTSSVLVAGHSVGARIGLELMHRLRREVPFHAYIGLFPTVMHIAQSTNGVRGAPLLRRAPLRKAAFWFVRCLALLKHVLSERALRAVARRIMRRDCPELDEYYTHVGVKLLDPFVVANVLHMANDEMVAILGSADAPVAHAAQHLDPQRVSFVLSPVDKWCDQPIVEQMRATFPRSSFDTLTPDVPHAFCLSHAAVEKVVRSLLAAVARAPSRGAPRTVCRSAS
jgi:hypothetical protein